jgi:hypothetical protein
VAIPTVLESLSDTPPRPVRFGVGDKVRKATGGYRATGTVVAAFATLAGERRVVFEFDAVPGLLHIFSEAQLEPIDR